MEEDRRRGDEMVGRDRELAAVVRAYHRTLAGGSPAGVILVGPAGVGRTRLAREVVDRLRAEGCRHTAWATGTRSAAEVPLGALAHLLPADNRVPTRSPDSPASLIAAFGRGVTSPVLVVDDAHLLDGASAAAVHDLATRRRVFVLLTLRAGSPAPDAVTALWADAAALRLDMVPLADEAVGMLIERVLDGPIDPVSERELRRLCGGRPLLLHELLRAGRATGVLRKRDDVWRWQNDGYVTTRLAEVVRQQFGSVTSAVREAVEPLACGGELPVPLLERVAGRDALAIAEAHQLVTITDSGQRLVAALTDPLFAEVTRSAIPRYREREICRTLAAAIEATPMRRADDEMRAAAWRLRAGLPVDTDVLLRAASRARERADLRMAEQLAVVARRGGGGWPADLALAEVLLSAGRTDQAATVLPAPYPNADHEQQVRWRVAQQRIEARITGGLRPGGDVAADATPTAAAARAWLFILGGRCDSGLNAAHAALRASDLPRAPRAWATSAAVAAAGLLGHAEQATAALSSGLAALAQAGGDLWERSQVGLAGCLAGVVGGRLADATDLAEQGYREAVDGAAQAGTRHDMVVGLWAAARGIVARNAGDTGTARRRLREAGVLMERSPTPGLLRLCWAELAAAHALAGDLDAANRWLRRADDADQPAGGLFEAWVERDRAWVAAASGDLPGAAAYAREAAARAAATGQPMMELIAWYDVARFGVPHARGNGAGEAWARLTDMAGRTGVAGAAVAAAATALHRADAARLDGASALLAGTGYLLYGAETAAQAHYGHLRDGRGSAARASLVRATELSHGCRRARTHLLDLTGDRRMLTPRELHVATLAAAGRTAPDIAAELDLSVRTVNNHLGRVYSKLGIAGRGGLTKVIHESK